LVGLIFFALATHGRQRNVCHIGVRIWPSCHGNVYFPCVLYNHGDAPLAEDADGEYGHIAPFQSLFALVADEFYISFGLRVQAAFEPPFIKISRPHNLSVGKS